MIKIYKVGGAVRDAFLGVKSKDIDYAVEAPSFDAMREYILNNGGKIFLETPEYFTMRAIMPNLGAADFVLCRRDGKYVDGRHPETVGVGTIQDDLARRDFTINAIAIEVDTGAVLDPFNGQQDIKDKIIRCVGNPIHRFQEDKLRIFRAARFAVCKEMMIDKYTSYAMDLLGNDFTYGGFTEISTERIREELNKMFTHDSYDSFYMLFEKYKGLGEIIRRRDIWFKPTTGKT